MRMDTTIWSTGQKKYSVYDKFRVDNEGTNYRLHVSGYTSGSDTDRWAYHNGMDFSTRDRDNDRSGGSCSQSNKGGHWYDACSRVNPTSLYRNRGFDSVCVKISCTTVKEMTLKVKSV